MPNENITWKGYLGYEIPASDADTVGVPEELKQNRINRDGTENFHVTVIGPPEVRKIIDDLVVSGEAPSKGKAKKLAKQKILDAAESLMSDWIDLGLGKAAGHEVYFRVINWPSAQQLRNEFGLPEKDFHITIGFGPEGDIHGVPKDSSTLLEKKFKLNEVANPINRRPENIRDEIEDKLDILVDDSNIHGLGAFAGRHFSEDEPIGIVLYKLKSPKHASDSTFKNFCFVGNDGEPYYQTHFGDYLNHSKESNVTLKKHGSNTYGVAGRDIENGEELSIDYNHPLAPVDPDPSWDLTPKYIHNLADKLGVPWDNDPSFMDFSERATGKRHLDDMGHTELKQLSDMLKKQQVGENSLKESITTLLTEAAFPFGGQGYDPPCQYEVNINRRLVKAGIRGSYSPDPKATFCYGGKAGDDSEFNAFDFNGNPGTYKLELKGGSGMKRDPEEINISSPAAKELLEGIKTSNTKEHVGNLVRKDLEMQVTDKGVVIEGPYDEIPQSTIDKITNYIIQTQADNISNAEKGIATTKSINLYYYYSRPKTAKTDLGIDSLFPLSVSAEEKVGIFLEKYPAAGVYYIQIETLGMFFLGKDPLNLESIGARNFSGNITTSGRVRLEASGGGPSKTIDVDVNVGGQLIKRKCKIGFRSFTFSGIEDLNVSGSNSSDLDLDDADDLDKFAQYVKQPAVPPQAVVEENSIRKLIRKVIKESLILEQNKGAIYEETLCNGLSAESSPFECGIERGIYDLKLEIKGNRLQQIHGAQPEANIEVKYGWDAQLGKFDKKRWKNFTYDKANGFRGELLNSEEYDHAEWLPVINLLLEKMNASTVAITNSDKLIDFIQAADPAWDGVLDLTKKFEAQSENVDLVWPSKLQGKPPTLGVDYEEKLTSSGTKKKVYPGTSKKWTDPRPSNPDYPLKEIGKDIKMPPLMKLMQWDTKKVDYVIIGNKKISPATEFAGWIGQVPGSSPPGFNPHMGTLVPNKELNTQIRWVGKGGDSGHTFSIDSKFMEGTQVVIEGGMNFSSPQDLAYLLIPEYGIPHREQQYENTERKLHSLICEIIQPKKKRLTKKDILATGMCFPFASQKAEEWFMKHIDRTKPRGKGIHPDIDNKDKFKVVHGTVTDKWESPPKPVVHAWVEMGDLVFDDQTKMTKPNGIDKEVYYGMYQPEVYKEYTAEEVVINCAKHGGGRPWDDELFAMMQKRDAWLQEKVQRGKGKKKRILYHAGQRPAVPKPKMRWLDRGQADNEWVRHWLASPVKSGVFLTPNPVDIAQFHGVSGNVYAYKVPEWVIKKSGGIHRFDKGSEILIPEDVWEEAGSEIEFLGKSMSQQELWDKINMSLHGSQGRFGNPQKPGWMSTKEWNEYQADRSRGDHISGLRATKHLENAIKMMTPEERAEALKAFEQHEPLRGSSWPDWVKSRMDDWDRPRTEKDLEIITLLKKHMNESLIRSLAEAYTPDDLPDDWYVEIQKYPVDPKVLQISVKDKSDVYSKALGQIVIEKHKDCSGAWEVIKSEGIIEHAGVGTMLYNIAMEIAGNDGLMPSRKKGEVSDYAKRVWQNFYQSGASEELDSECNQNGALEAQLSNRYFTSGKPTITRLEELGKWKDLGEVQEGVLKDYIKSQIKLFGKERYNKIKKVTLGAYWDQLYA